LRKHPEEQLFWQDFSELLKCQVEKGGGLDGKVGGLFGEAITPLVDGNIMNIIQFERLNAL